MKKVMIYVMLLMAVTVNLLAAPTSQTLTKDGVDATTIDIPENAPAGYVLGTIDATVSDAGLYELIKFGAKGGSGQNGLLTVDAATGVVTLTAALTTLTDGDAFTIQLRCVEVEILNNANQNGGQLVATYNLNVGAATVSNTAPVITGTPGTTVVATNLYTFTPTATDADVGDTLEFSIVNKPSWASFSTTTGELTGTPTHETTDDQTGIIITVIDGNGGSDNLASFDIDVTAVVVGNNAPTINGSPATTVAEGAAYSFVPTGFDADDDTLTYSIQNEPTWTTFDPVDGSLVGNPTNADIGTYSNIIISVSDGNGGSADLAAFDLEVTAVLDNGTVTIAAQARSIDENSTKYTVVPGGEIAVTATYPDNIEYSTDDEYFNMEKYGYMFLRKNVSLDFETEDTYVVTVTVTDVVSGATDTADVTITLNDLAEDGTIELNTQFFLIEAQTLLAGAATQFNVAAEGTNAVYTTTSTEFTIDSVTGLLSIIDETILVTGDIFTIPVTVTIGLNNQAANVTIEVVDELPDEDKPGRGPRFRKSSGGTCVVGSLGANGHLLFSLIALFTLLVIMPKKKKVMIQ